MSKDFNPGEIIYVYQSPVIPQVCGLFVGVEDGKARVKHYNEATGVISGNFTAPLEHVFNTKNEWQEFWDKTKEKQNQPYVKNVEALEKIKEILAKVSNPDDAKVVPSIIARIDNSISKIDAHCCAESFI